MLSCQLRGGLGNQLFQMAAAINLAIENDDEYAFDLNSILTMQGKHAIAYKDTVYEKIRANLPHNWWPEYIYTEPHLDRQAYEPIPYHENMMIDGYFQSEKFFVNNKEEIIILFINDKIVTDLKQKYSDILKNSVSIHIRRGDYVKIGEAMEMDYYEFALECLYEDYPVDHVLIFSDDIAWCKENLHYAKAVYIEGLEDYQDMYLISLCTHNITGNSSFSWWGAYLNRNPLKRIFMPKPFTTSHGDDIYFKNVSIISI